MNRIASLTRTRTLVSALLGALLVTSLAAAGSAEAKPKKKKQKVPLASKFDVRPIAGGFDRSISFDFLPNGKLLVAEKRGTLWIVENGSKRLLLDLQGQIVNMRERGLEGIEVASDFASSRRIYLIYAFMANPLKLTGPQALRVSYLTLTPDDRVANPAAPLTTVLGKDTAGPCPAISNKFDCPASIAATHQGGTVLSAPDGTLWVGFGDSNLPESPGGQVFRTYNPASTAGKILHIDTNGNGLKGHPFCRKKTNLELTCTKVYARGFRNPFRFTLTPSGRPIVADVGWNQREEIDLVKKGRNYGWPCKEGSIRTAFYRDRKRCQNLYKKPRKLTNPIYEYRNNPGAGAAVIMGPQHGSPFYPPGLKGAYFFGDYASTFIKEGVLRKGRLKGIRTVATGVLPVQFRHAPSGNIAFVDFLGGTVNEIVYAPNKSPVAVASASPQAFCPPANATAVQFSSAGTSDLEGDALSYAWDFDSNGSTDSTASSPTHTYPSNGTHTATLRVSDGISTGTARVRVFAGNCPPSVAIQNPYLPSGFRIGNLVPLGATGSDAEDGSLPNSAFQWDVILVHKGHKHEVGTFTGKAAQFQPVTDHDADSFYEVTLSVTDSSGYTRVLPKITLSPQTVRLRLRTNVGKVKLSYGGRPIKVPRKFQAAIGFRATLSAPAKVRNGRKLYRFKRWGHGGRRNQVFKIPAKKRKLVAKYRRVG